VKQYIHSFSDINKIIDWTWSFRFYNSVDSSWTMKWSRMGAHHRLIPLRGHAPLLLIWSSRWAPSMTKHHNSYPSIHPSIHLRIDHVSASEVTERAITSCFHAPHMATPLQPGFGARTGRVEFVTHTRTPSPGKHISTRRTREIEARPHRVKSRWRI
jgi:hypothetical protein